MATKSIEESARKFAYERRCYFTSTDVDGREIEWKCPLMRPDCSCDEYRATYNEYIKVATEQDRIARQEERERCIKAAQKFQCNKCLYKCCAIRRSDFNEGMCITLLNIRKAMEGGNQNESKTSKES